MSTGRSTHSEPHYATKMPYVFGSSTPREFSYMDHVPAKYRIYDTKFHQSRRAKEEMTLKDYIRMIRSSSPTSGRRGRSADSAGSLFVFGSSTPRKWSHMDKIPVEYRIYDVSLNRRRHKRSKTTSFVPSSAESNASSRYTKSQSSFGVGANHSDHRSANGTRTRSVPASSLRRHDDTSIETQRSMKSDATSASIPKQLRENFAASDVKRASLMTPNEDMVLVVTETVTNIAHQSAMPDADDHREEIVGVEHEEASNVAISSSIEKASNHVMDTMDHNAAGQDRRILTDQQQMVVVENSEHKVVPQMNNEKVQEPAGKILNHSDKHDNDDEPDIIEEEEIQND